MASVTVSHGKVTKVKNGKKSNAHLSDNYSSNGYKRVSTSSPTGAKITTETPYSGTNVSTNTPVLGSMDAPAYGLTSSNTGNKTGVMRNPTDKQISGLGNSVPYNPDDPGGYAPDKERGLKGNTYAARQSAFTFNDDNGQKTIYSNYTNYEDARNAAIASGELSPNASFQGASTYGTASLGTKKGYNYGGTVGGGGYSGFGADAYISDKQYGKMYDQNNMQLAYLSGRDGMDYTNPYANLSYTGNGLSNAYLKGLENYGTGSTAGAYGVGQAGATGNALTNSAIANYGGLQYQGLSGSDIQNRMDGIANNYADAVGNYNKSLSAGYDYQQDRNNQDAEDNARALYIQKSIAEKNIPKQLASQGITGGLTESTLAGIYSNYQNAYNDNQKNLTNANTQLQVAKQQAIASNNMQAATQYATLQQQTISLQQSAMQAENSFNLSLAQMQQSQSNADRQYALTLAQMDLDKAKNDYDQTIENATIAYNAGDYNTYAQILSELDGFEDFDTTYLQQQQALTALSNQLSYDTALADYQKKTTNVGYSGSSGSKTKSTSSKSSGGTVSKLSSSPITTTTKTGVTTSNGTNVDPYNLLMAIRYSKTNGLKTLL